MRWRVRKEGKDKFWKLDHLDALVINRSGVAAAGGWTEDAEIWVAGGGRGKGWVVGGGMRGAWIGGNIGFRISAIRLVQVASVFPFVVILVARIVGLCIGGGRESLRCGSGPPTTSFRRRCGGRGGGSAWCAGVRCIVSNARGRIAVSRSALDELESNFGEDGAVCTVVSCFVGGFMAHHALLRAILAAVVPARHVVVEGARGYGLVWVAGAIASTCCGGSGGARCFPILANGPFPWVLVICKTLLHYGLQCGGREGVAAKGEILDYPMVAREK